MRRNDQNGLRYKNKPNRFQDRQAFLSFLREQRKCGLQAIRVLPTHTYFKRDPGAFTQYDLSFENGEKEERNLFAHKNGIVICPSPSTTDDLTWCENVVSDYDQFTMYSRVRLINDFLRCCTILIILIPAIYVFNLFSQIPQFAGYKGRAWTMIALFGGVSIFLLINLIISLLVWYVNQVHFMEMRKAVNLHKPYCTPERIKKTVKVKNFWRVYSSELC